MAFAAVGLATHIANNHLRSALLLAGFPVLLAAMLWAFFASLGWLSQSALGAPVNWNTVAAEANKGLLAYGHWAILAAGIWFVIAYFFHGAMMRAATSSRPITRDEMPRIYNLLENLCIAQGLPMPAFEIIDSQALNAYASGINDKTYKIVLTRGIVDRLSDDELEGVIAHELTHIVNRDVRLLIIAVIFAGMLTFLAELVFRGLVYGPRRRDGRGAGGIMLLALLILGVGYVFSLVIRFALSRRREYLADAGAVEMTRNPDAMMRALLRISGQDRVRGMPDDVQMMCIENSHAFMGLFATHPPIAARVAVLSRMTDTPVPDLGHDGTAPAGPQNVGPQNPGPWSR